MEAALDPSKSAVCATIRGARLTVSMITFRLLPLPLLLVLASAAPKAPPRQASGLPPIVFVSRSPVTAAVDPQAFGPRAVPGLGPRHRAAAPGGRLLIRRANGRVDPLVRDGVFHDVADPTVTGDGRRVAFAATVSPDSGWRIWTVFADGSGLAAVTRTDRAVDLSPLGRAAPRFERYDDLDPAWLVDGRICFSSTRFPLMAEQGGRAATNLWVVNADGGRLHRITTDRSGADEPSVDGETGRVVYARWWFNRHLASEVDPSGITNDSARALPADAVDLWHAISILSDGDGGRLAGGHPRVRQETMAYQPIVLADGTLIGVHAERGSLLPDGGVLTLHAFPKRFAPPVVLAGGPKGGSACAPAELPDGRILFSWDREGNGDFGLYVVRRDGSRLERVLDLPGTLELDGAVLAKRRMPPPLVFTPQMDLPNALPVLHERQLRDSVITFRFDCLNVFANAPVDAPFPDAPPLDQDIFIRFYAALSRPEADGGDTVLLIRTAPLTRAGAVHEHELPADAPLFEQLVDAHGKVLRSPTGPAHVPGFNSGRFGHGTKCVGCHLGHSAIPVANSAGQGKRFNASTSAEVTASSSAPGTAGPRAAVDRRATGPAGEVGWVAGAGAGERIRLQWRRTLEVDTLVIYSLSPDFTEGTDLRIQELEVAFFQNGREIRRDVLRRELSPRGTRISCGGLRVDALEVRPLRVVGRVLGRAAVGLAEIETRARLTEY